MIHHEQMERMKTTISGSTGFTGKVLLKQVLLVCGIFSSLVYAGADILGGVLWKGYSFTSQPVSDLSAIGAPSRPFVVPLLILYDVLFLAFALGVWGLAGQRRALRFIGCVLVGLGVINVVAIFTPEHLGEAAATLANTIHITLAGVTSFLILVQLGCGAFVLGKRFRLYSVGTLLTLLIVGALVGLGAAQYVANQASPWIGITERILIYGYMLWVAVLAIVLLRAERAQMQIAK
jgi:hypothetical protein